MQYFKDAVGGKIHALDDDVKAVSAGGVWSFSTKKGVALTRLPTTLQPAEAPAPVPPTLAQRAHVILMPRGTGAGLVLTCSTNVALNGTYAIDHVSIAKMTSIVSAGCAGGATPSGEPTFNYPDIAGAMHPWTAEKFPAFVQAAVRLVYALEMTIAGVTSALPATVAAIP